MLLVYICIVPVLVYNYVGRPTSDPGAIRNPQLHDALNTENQMWANLLNIYFFFQIKQTNTA